MHKLPVKYSLLLLAALCFSVSSADNTSTTGSSADQTTTGSPGMTPAEASYPQSNAAASAATDDDSAGVAGQNLAGTVTINFFNTSDLELTKVSTTLENSCWGNAAPETIPANGRITMVSNNCSSKSTDAALEYSAPSGEIFTFSWSGTSTNTRSFAANSSSDQYNLKYVEDKDRDDDRVVINYFLTPVATKSAFSIVVGSDTQAWRQDNNADPNNNQGPWEGYMRNVVRGINSVSAGKKFMIVNGDLTEFGRDSQRNSYHSVMNGLNINYYWGLGNHDYANNVNDCTDPPNLSYNACAREAVDAMGETLQDWYVNMLPGFFYYWQTNDHPYSGSLGYAWDEGNIRFIQLQNYPTYEVWLDHWFNPPRQIRQSLSFLLMNLTLYMKQGQVAVINMHDYSDHFRKNSTAEERDAFRYFLNTYPVLAVFGGHTHQPGVFNRNGGDSFFGRVPVFNSGALYKGDFMLVDFYDKCLIASARNGKNGGADMVQHYGSLCMDDVEKNATGNTATTTLPADPLIIESHLSQRDSSQQDSIQIVSRSDESLCLAAAPGANAALAPCGTPETYFNPEERSRGYSKLVSTVDPVLCLKASSTDDTITLAACEGDNSTGDLTSLRLWLLPNNQQGYLLQNKYKLDQCPDTSGGTEKAANAASCGASGDANALTSAEWILKRDNVELQPTDGQDY